MCSYSDVHDVFNVVVLRNIICGGNAPFPHLMKRKGRQGDNPIFTWDVEGRLQRLLWIPRLSHWRSFCFCVPNYYSDVIMGTMAAQITSLTIVYSTVYSDANQRKPQSSASLAFVWGIHRRAVNSPHKGPATRKMFPFDDVIMWTSLKIHHGPDDSCDCRHNCFIGVTKPLLNSQLILWHLVTGFSINGQ